MVPKREWWAVDSGWWTVDGGSVSDGAGGSESFNTEITEEQRETKTRGGSWPALRDYPTQANRRLEWGTRRLVDGVVT